MNIGPDITGLTFGRLLVLGRGSGPKGRGTYWLCVCRCGTQKNFRRDGLLSGSSQSCGCLQKDSVRASNYVHGGAVRGTRDRAYGSWKSMMSRCYDPNHEAHGRYAGRGIKVCDRWHDFRNFRVDMGERPLGLTLERVDNDRGYDPGNCEWRTPKEQANNRRDNVLVSFDGKTKTVSAWAAFIGIPRDSLDRRFRNGWSIERSLTEPIHAEKQNRKTPERETDYGQRPTQ